MPHSCPSKPVHANARRATPSPACRFTPSLASSRRSQPYLPSPSQARLPAAGLAKALRAPPRLPLLGEPLHAFTGLPTPCLPSPSSACPSRPCLGSPAIPSRAMPQPAAPWPTCPGLRCPGQHTATDFGSSLADGIDHARKFADVTVSLLPSLQLCDGVHDGAIPQFLITHHFHRR